QIVTAAGDRLKVFGDILDYADFFLPDDKLPYDEKAFDKRIRLPPSAVELLGELKSLLSSIDEFSAEALELSIKKFAEEHNLQMAQIVHPLRIALTGKGIGFGLFDTLALLGREKSIGRIDRASSR